MAPFKNSFNPVSIYISDKKIAMAYYNTTSKQTFFGFYDRKTQKELVNSHISLTIPYQEYQRRDAFVSVINKNQFQILTEENRLF